MVDWAITDWSSWIWLTSRERSRQVQHDGAHLLLFSLHWQDESTRIFVQSQQVGELVIAAGRFEDIHVERDGHQAVIDIGGQIRREVPAFGSMGQLEGILGLFPAVDAHSGRLDGRLDGFLDHLEQVFQVHAARQVGGDDVQG